MENNMIKRILSMALAVVMIAGLFVLPVSATELTPVPSDVKLNYTNTADALKPLAADYTYGTGEGQSGLGTQISTSDWRLRNAAESPDGMGVDGTDKPATFGITTGGYLYVQGRSALKKDQNTELYNTETANKIPAIVLDTENLADLSSNHKIKVEMYRSAGAMTTGIRFMAHNNGKNYYALVWNGKVVPNKANKIELYKSVDGKVRLLDTIGENASEGGFVWTELEMNNGTIGVRVGDLRKTYVDDEPFTVSGRDAKIWFMAMNDGGSNNRFGQFRNIVINNYSPFVTETPENIMSVDVSEGKDADEEGVIDFGKAVPVRKLLYSGDAADKNILVSNDRTNWYILTNTAKFANGVWQNTITGTPYRYVKTEGFTDEIKFLTEVYEIKTEFTGDPITLYPRIKNKDAFGTATITSSSNAVAVNGAVITPSSKGTATVTATYNVDGTDYSISIPVNVKGEQEFSYIDDISNAATQTLTGLGNQIVGTKWRMRNAAETPDGLKTYNDGTAVDYGKNADGIFVGASYDPTPRYDTEVAKKIPALVLTQDLTGLTKEHKISYDLRKDNNQTVTTGIRFMVHNNGKNYYALIFGGNNYNGDRRWELVKSVDGVVLNDALMKGTVNEYPKQSVMVDRANEFWNVVIEIQGNSISFTATDVNNSQNTFGATYEDKDMFNVSGNDAGVWLMAMNGNNGANNSYARKATFRNFKIENSTPYLNGKEPAKVVYMDVAEGKTADENGVIDLGAHWGIRRVEASGTGEVLVSEDNQRWFSIGNLENGKVFNTLTVKEMRYVKVAGATDVKVLTEVSGNKFDLIVGDEKTLYPYFDGEIPADVTITSNSSSVKVEGNKIKAVASGQGIKITIASETADNSIEIAVESSMGDVSEFTYTVNEEDETKWDFNIEAPRVKNVNYTVIIAFYNADDCLKSAQVFKDVEFDGRGLASFTADKTELEAGDYALGFIWNNLDEVKPAMKVSPVEISQ